MVNPQLVVLKEKLNQQKLNQKDMIINRKSIMPQNIMVEVRIYNDFEEAFFYEKKNLINLVDFLEKKRNYVF